jgi:uncharacterized membrane protein YhhN
MHILILTGAVLALIYGLWFCWRAESWLRSVIKTGSVVLPAIALGQMGMPGLALAGLWACALGDFLLSRPGEAILKAGIAAFALGHVLYVLAFFTVLPVGAPDLLFWITAAGLVVLGLSTERWLSPHTGDLRGVVRGYVVLILAMGVVAALPWQGRVWVLAGALCFVASDLILATQLFLGGRSRGAAYAIWALYWGAQALIMTGFYVFAAL